MVSVSLSLMFTCTVCLLYLTWSKAAIIGLNVAVAHVYTFISFISAPNFVSSMTQGDFVYFFFRETAVEYINCGKVICLDFTLLFFKNWSQNRTSSEGKSVIFLWNLYWHMLATCLAFCSHFSRIYFLVKMTYFVLITS